MLAKETDFKGRHLCDASAKRSARRTRDGGPKFESFPLGAISGELRLACLSLDSSRPSASHHAVRRRSIAALWVLPDPGIGIDCHPDVRWTVRGGGFHWTRGHRWRIAPARFGAPVNEMHDAAFRNGTQNSIFGPEKAFANVPEIHSRMLEFVQQQAIMVGQIAGCNRLHGSEQRLIRWLLSAQDRTHSADLKFTHQYLAEMIASQRTTVTVIARDLQERGFIRYSRGTVHIVDRDGLRRPHVIVTRLSRHCTRASIAATALSHPLNRWFPPPLDRFRLVPELEIAMSTKDRRGIGQTFHRRK